MSKRRAWATCSTHACCMSGARGPVSAGKECCQQVVWFLWLICKCLQVAVVGCVGVANTIPCPGPQQQAASGLHLWHPERVCSQQASYIGGLGVVTVSG
jgi:hypothetical protein